jgi:phospholipid transport system substrate-binding protein
MFMEIRTMKTIKLVVLSTLLMTTTILAHAIITNTNNINASSAVITSANNASDNNNKTLPTVSGATSSIECPEDSPCGIVQRTSDKVLKAINRGLSSNQTMPLIQTVIVPQFDFSLMTKFAMGINWKQANSKQQTQLVDLFKQLLVYTYSNALYKFRGGHVNITDQKIIDKRAVVATTVVLPNSASNQPIKVEYDLAKTGTDGSWKVYDIKIENASLVTTYRNQFNEIIQNSKVDGLITQLRTKVNTLEKSKG